MAAEIAIEPRQVEQYILELACHGACEETGVCRPAYSPAWVAAQQTVMGWCRAAGLTTWQDAAGNVWGRLAGEEPAPVVATGSHVDSQLPGGRYDGALGIAGGVLALAALKQRYGQPRRTIDVVSFAMEESSRFPRGNFFSSRAVVGPLDPAELDSKLSYDGEPLREVLRAAGLDPARIAEAHRDDIGDFLELHVEQGPILEEAGLAVGIVDAITGSMSFNVTLHGRADHAGGCPMDLRRDPMRVAAPLIEGVLATASAMGRPAVTTVGRMLVEPNFGGIVPERVTLSINARHPDPAGYAELRARHEALLAEVAAAHPEVGVEWTFSGGTPTPCSPELVHLLEDVARREGIPARTLPSGGGHDCQIMARRCRAAMIFAQSRDGRSHTPEEYTAPEHAAQAITLLAAALHELAYA